MPTGMTTEAQALLAVEMLFLLAQRQPLVEVVHLLLMPSASSLPAAFSGTCSNVHDVHRDDMQPRPWDKTGSACLTLHKPAAFQRSYSQEWL